MNFYSFIGGTTLLQLVGWFILLRWIDLHDRKQRYVFNKYPFVCFAAYLVGSVILTIVVDMVLVGLYMICP